MSTKTLLSQLAEFGVGLEIGDIGSTRTETLKSRVLDILGICLAAGSLDTSQAIKRYAREIGGVGESSAVGVTDRLPAAQAALVNGVLAHSLDYDDTHLPSVLHPSASVIPAVLAVAESEQVSGAETLKAIVFGLEVTVRLGMAGYDQSFGNSLFFENGQHATSICGAIGSAAAVASLYRDASLIENSMGVAASMASGILEANRTGGNVKRLHCGWAAHSAVSAVALSRHGFTGPLSVLEGRFGFFQAWLHGRFDANMVNKSLGEHWESDRIVFKPYPANHFTHAAIDAAAEMRRGGLDLANIDRIVLGVPAPNVRTIGEPIAVKRQPETGYMAQFSGPYAVAAGLLGGGGLEVGLDDFTDQLARDPVRRGIMEKVEVAADDECTSLFPVSLPAVLRVWLKNGEFLEKKILSNRGSEGWPLSFDELSSKFFDNARRSVSIEGAISIKHYCATFESIGNINELMTELRYESAS